MDNLIPAAILIVAGGTGIGSGRLVPTVAAIVGLVGVIVGGLALARSSSHIGSRRPQAIAAGMAGLISLVVGGLHSAYSAGTFGTGNGLAGAIVAIVLGLSSMILGGLAVFRSRFADPRQFVDSRQDGPARELPD